MSVPLVLPTMYLRGNVRGAPNARFHRSDCPYLPAETLEWRWPHLRGLNEMETLRRTFLVKNRIQPCLHCFPLARKLRTSPPEVCEGCGNVVGEGIFGERHESWCEFYGV